MGKKKKKGPPTLRGKKKKCIPLFRGGSPKPKGNKKGRKGGRLLLSQKEKNRAEPSPPKKRLELQWGKDRVQGRGGEKGMAVLRREKKKTGPIGGQS